MQNIAEIEEKVWRYLDNNCSNAERDFITIQIEKNAEWKAIYAKAILIHSELNALDMQQPSMRFTKNVMEEISTAEVAPKIAKYINHQAIRFVLYTSVLAIFAIFTYTIIYTDWNAATATRFSYLEKLSNPTVGYSLTFVGIIAFLVLLDTILRTKKNIEHSTPL